MQRILLIPGYGSSLTKWIIKPTVKPERNFTIFTHLVIQEHAIVFPWNITRHLSFTQFLNPFIHLRIYNKEKQLAQSNTLHKQLDLYIKKYQPEMIICHSLGCFLLYSYLQHYSLSSTINTIIFVQADIPRDVTIPVSIQLINYYCPWDVTLLSSLLLHKYIPAGLLGLKDKKIRNRFFPLIYHINLHLSTIKSKKFFQEVLKL